MPPRTSGLQRDVRLIRRRGWLFLPFLALGVVVAIVFNAFAGETNAVAEIELDTVIHDPGSAGERGLRIYEALSMTDDPEFVAQVLAEIGEEEFDYDERFELDLTPTSVAPGVSRGVLTISVKDRSRGDAKRYRDAFVSVFEREFLALDGLFRRRFVESVTHVAAEAEAHFVDAYAELRAATAARSIPVDELFRSRQGTNPLDSLNVQEAELRRELARAEAALAAARDAGLSATAVASLAAGVLGEEVRPGDGEEVLTAHAASLEAALASISGRIAALSDGSLAPALLAKLDEVRALDWAKETAWLRVVNARVAVESTESWMHVERTASGGLAGSVAGLIAVTLALTLVFGLIAIYTVEWLAQVRREDAP